MCISIIITCINRGSIYPAIYFSSQKIIAGCINAGIKFFKTPFYICYHQVPYLKFNFAVNRIYYPFFFFWIFHFLIFIKINYYLTVPKTGEVDYIKVTTSKLNMLERMVIYLFQNFHVIKD